MTSHEFSQRVVDCTVLARNNPRGYRYRLFLLGLLGYAYIALVVLLLGLLAWALLRTIGGGAHAGALVELGASLAAATWVVLRTLRVPVTPPRGITLTPALEPRLFAEIERIRRTLRAPRIHRVILDGELNAAVMQVPRFGPFGQRNLLVLGQALMATLSLDEFRTVLAHEMAHLAGRHGRFAVWVYGLRARWLQLLASLTANGRWSRFLYRHFFEWYAPWFQATSMPLSREHEFAADRGAVAIGGGQAFADGLGRTVVTGRFLGARFQPVARRLPVGHAEPPSDYPDLLRQAAQRAFESRNGELWLRQALAGTTHVADTHPCFTDRLRAAGVPVPDASAWCRRLGSRVGITTAESLLDSPEEHTRQLGVEWAESAGRTWVERREHYTRLREEARALEARVALRRAEPGDGVRAVELTLALEGARKARNPARDLAVAHPDDPDVRFLLGAILAELDDADAIAHLEFAMSRDPARARTGLAAGYGLLRRLGRDRDAAAFEQCWDSTADRHVSGAWTTPMSEADRTRVRAARSETDTPAPAPGPSPLRFRRGSSTGVYASVALLVVAAVAVGIITWIYLTPRRIPYSNLYDAGLLGTAALLGLLPLYRRLIGDINLTADRIIVREDRDARDLKWSEVRDIGLRGRALVLWSNAGVLRATTRRPEFPLLCDAVVKRVMAARREATARPATPQPPRKRAEIEAASATKTFRRGLRLLLPLVALQFAMLGVGAVRAPGLMVAGAIALAVTTWRLSRMAFAVSVDVRWIEVRSPIRSDSILVAALADVDIARTGNEFAVVVFDRFGNARAVPAVNGDLLGLHDAIRQNLELARRPAT